MNPFTLLRNGLNRLLPFATPGTPLIQDLLHLAALCTVLYYAPQIQTFVQERLNAESGNGAEDQTDASSNQNDQAPANTNLESARDHQARAGAGVAAAVHQPAEPNWAPAQVDDDDDDEDNDDENDSDDDNNPEDNPLNGQPGPAAVNPRTTTPRTVGAKKAKSLARRDQRRAYHEFMRSQGEAQRARDAEEAKERESFAAEERARRGAAEAELELKRAREREERREREGRSRTVEMERRENTVIAVREEVARRGVCDLDVVARGIGGVDREWVEGLVRASGMLNEGAQNERVLVTQSGWAVRVTGEYLDEAYRALLEGDGVGDGEGRVSTRQLGTLLERIVFREDTEGAVAG